MIFDGNHAGVSRSLAGTVAEIWRYPVKSMRGESVGGAAFRWTGIAGDRLFAFVRTGDRSRFPWLTGRVVPDMVIYRAHHRNQADVHHSDAVVTSPDGRSFEFWDPALASLLGDLAGEPVHPMRLGRGAFDQHPVSVVTTGTLRRLSAGAGREVDPRRFRINIVIAEAEDAPAEIDWVGRDLTFGDDDAGPRLRIDEPAERCAMVTIDPDTGSRQADVMRVVARNFDNKVGLYCAPVVLGNVAIGDRVWLAD
jgi:uncharacterized protein YcbX